MAKTINRFLRNFGYEIKPYPNKDLNRRLKLIFNHNVDLILDIGASIGEYGNIIRSLGYKGRIVSFEPIQESFTKLQENAQDDPLWDVYNCALGNENKQSIIHISENYDSSSILEINNIHLDARKSSSVDASQAINIKKLDSVYSDFSRSEKNIFVKMDTQGYEKYVIEGASSVLQAAVGLQIELSLIPLYDNSETFDTIISLLEKFGFKLFSIEPGFYNKQTGRLLQFDGIFFKES